MRVFLYFCNLIIPAILLIAGAHLQFHPPKEINRTYGYRTQRSMYSQETWDLAQSVAGRNFLRVGSIMMVIMLLVQIPFARMGKDAMCVATLFLTVANFAALLISIPMTENVLEETFFDENGYWKKKRAAQQARKDKRKN